MIWTNKYGWVWIAWMTLLLMLGIHELIVGDFTFWWLAIFLPIYYGSWQMVRINTKNKESKK